jgi:hypothetical protein
MSILYKNCRKYRYSIVDMYLMRKQYTTLKGKALVTVKVNIEGCTSYQWSSVAGEGLSFGTLLVHEPYECFSSNEVTTRTVNI